MAPRCRAARSLRRTGQEALGERYTKSITPRATSFFFTSLAETGLLLPPPTSLRLLMIVTMRKEYDSEDGRDQRPGWLLRTYADPTIDVLFWLSETRTRCAVVLATGCAVPDPTSPPPPAPRLLYCTYNTFRVSATTIYLCMRGCTTSLSHCHIALRTWITHAGGWPLLFSRFDLHRLSSVTGVPTRCRAICISVWFDVCDYGRTLAHMPWSLQAPRIVHSSRPDPIYVVCGLV